MTQLEHATERKKMGNYRSVLDILLILMYLVGLKAMQNCLSTN